MTELSEAQPIRKLIAKTEMPYPPSVNAFMKRTRHGGMMLTDKARAYKRDTYYLTRHARPSAPFEGRMAGKFTIHAPTRRKYDLDNCMKVLNDSLEQAGFFLDDEQFDEITIVRGEVIKGGRVDVELYEIEGVK